ncbi:MAG: type III pantothenate kinase [Tenuifilaceae bacterium]
MNLIIDIGNSLTKVAITDKDKVVFIERHETLTKEIIDDIRKEYSPKRAIISAVGKKNTDVFDFLKSSLPLIELDQNTKLPIVNLYKTPVTLGRDRIAAAVGANYLYPTSNILVIDCGTAITYDLIDSKNQYHGGAISPGIQLRFKSLNQHTAHLPLLEKTDSFQLIGTTTVECIHSGVLNGVVSELENYINQLKSENPGLIVVLTGGDANFFVNKLKNSIFVVQNLVIIGLNRILNFNV